MAVWIHPSFPVCDHCGKRHFSGALEDCIEILEVRCHELKAERDKSDNRLRKLESALKKIVDHEGVWIGDPISAEHGEYQRGLVNGLWACAIIARKALEQK